jgi:hypothetical protein
MRCFRTCQGKSRAASRRDHDAGQVGGKAAGDDQADTAARALGVEGGQALEAIFLFFQAGVHRTHQVRLRKVVKPRSSGASRWG